MAVTLRSAYGPEKLAQVAVNDQVEIWHGNWARHVWAAVLEISFTKAIKYGGGTFIESARVTVVFRSYEGSEWRVVTLPVRAFSEDIRQCYTPDAPVYSDAERGVLLRGLAGREYAEPNVLVASLV